MAIESFSDLAELCKALACHGRGVPDACRFQAGCAAAPEALLLPFVPVAFDLYRPLKPRLRWAMQCLVSFADHAGRCFPSIRTFATHAGISKSAAGRDLAELVEAGLVTRKRRPGGVYVYRVARKFLPRWAKEQVSQAWDRQRKAQQARRAERAVRAVPVSGTEEKSDKKNQRAAQARGGFAGRKVSYGEMPDERAKWEARLRSWRKSGFWLPSFGPAPTDAGCFAPVALLEGLRDA